MTAGPVGQPAARIARMKLALASASLRLQLLLLPLLVAAPVTLVWDIDKSASVRTPPGVLRGDRGLSCSEKWCDGQNGNATNVYVSSTIHTAAQAEHLLSYIRSCG